MKLDEILHLAGKHKRRTRVGRGTGSGHGKTSGRGTKGYYSRSGAVHRLGYEGGGTTLVLRMPKRGFSNAQFAQHYQVVNVCDLEAFPEGSRVDAEALAKAGLIDHAKRAVKVLGDGELKRKLTVAANRFSASAIAKILGAGGAATTPTGEAVLPPPPPAPKPAPAPKPEPGAKAKAKKEGGKAKAGQNDEAGAKEEGDKPKKAAKPKDAGKAKDAGKSKPADKPEGGGKPKPATDE